MYNFGQLLKDFFQDNSIQLNSDIYEVGLINIIGLIGIVSFALNDFLGSLLRERNTTITSSIENAENKLRTAELRLIEAKKQLNQIDLVIAEIKNETLSKKKTLLEFHASKIKEEVKVYFDRSLSIFRTTQRQIFLDIKQRITTLTLQRVLSQAKDSLFTYETALSLTDRAINNLEGDFL